MKDRLLPYETIVKAHEGDPAAMQAVLDRYAGFIRYFSRMNGYYNADGELHQNQADRKSIQIPV